MTPGKPRILCVDDEPLNHFAPAILLAFRECAPQFAEIYDTLMQGMLTEKVKEGSRKAIWL